MTTRTILIVGTIILLAGPAMAVTVCYPRAQMLSYLAREYAAERVANGIVRPFSIMELWASPENGDWLIVETDLNEVSCILSYGEQLSTDVGVSPGARG